MYTDFIGVLWEVNVFKYLTQSLCLEGAVILIAVVVIDVYNIILRFSLALE